MAHKYGEQDANQKIVARMIELAKESHARQLLDKRDKIEISCDDDDDEEVFDKEKDKVVRSPSIMRMACNTLEVLRLREELI